MADLNELAACPNPWCESKTPPLILHLVLSGCWCVVCRCAVFSPSKQTKAEAISAWNSRATPTPADQGDLVEDGAKGAGFVDAQRIAYKAGYNEGYEDGCGQVDHDAAEEGWGQYLENGRCIYTDPDHAAELTRLKAELHEQRLTDDITLTAFQKACDKVEKMDSVITAMTADLAAKDAVIDGLVEAIEPFANRMTIQESLENPHACEWIGGNPSDRLDGRKRHDEQVRAARTALANAKAARP